MPNDPPAAPLEAPVRHDAHQLPRNVKLLGVTSLVNDIASEMIFPVLPDFVLTVLGGTKMDLGVIEGAADAAASTLKLFAGSWSDRSGRRKGWIVGGYSLAAIARPALALVTAPWQIFACRVGDRIGKGLRAAARDALIAESTAPAARGWAFGFHRAMDHVGAAVGPLLAVAFLYFWPDEFRTLFAITLLPGLAVLAILLFGLREARVAPRSEKFVWSLGPFDGNFRLYLLSLAVFTLGNSSDAFLLVRAGELGVPAWGLPLLWAGFSMAKSVGNLLAGRAVATLGTRSMIFVGWIVYAVVYLGFGLASAAWELWLLFPAYALFYALTEPAEKTLVAELVQGERKGLAYGWYNFAMGITLLPASVLFGKLYDEFGALAAFGTGAGLAIAAALLLGGVRVHSHPSSEDATR